MTGQKNMVKLFDPMTTDYMPLCYWRETWGRLRQHLKQVHGVPSVGASTSQHGVVEEVLLSVGDKKEAFSAEERSIKTNDDDVSALSSAERTTSSSFGAFFPDGTAVPSAAAVIRAFEPVWPFLLGKSAHSPDGHGETVLAHNLLGLFGVEHEPEKYEFVPVAAPKREVITPGPISPTFGYTKTPAQSRFVVSGRLVGGGGCGHA